MFLDPTPTPGPYPPSFPPQEPATLGDWLFSAVANIWEWVGNQQGPLVVLTAVATAIIAIIALRSTANDSRERSRPIILTFFRKSPNNESAFDLVLHNYGVSAAFDVRVEFTPPFSAEQRSVDHMVDALAQRYEKPIPVMPPGADITNVWWALDFAAPNLSGKNRHNIPDEAEVTISYKGNRIRRYKETVKLDTNWMKGDSSTQSSASRPGMAKQNTESLKKIAAEMRGANLRLRDIAENTSPNAQPDNPERADVSDLATAITESAGDMVALAARLGVTERQAAAIAALVDSQPETGDIDVISNGQITPSGKSA